MVATFRIEPALNGSVPAALSARLFRPSPSASAFVESPLALYFSSQTSPIPLWLKSVSARREQHVVRIRPTTTATQPFNCDGRSEEHTSELQSRFGISYA